MRASQDFKIADRLVGPGNAPFVIAEMSGNHNQSLDRALQIVEAAGQAGAHALKLQTYTADTMTLDVDMPGFRIDDAKSLWAGASLYQLYEQAHTPWEWHAPIFARARELGMIPLSTPFDNTAVDFLETLDAAVYKIASFENTDLPLIRRVAATGKPMIISTGMATVGELAETVQAARDAGCKDLVLLKCTSTYPATPANTNLATIPHMRELFDCQVGLSDHTMGVGVSVASVVLGATVIEKHFTLARADGGVDSTFSLEPHEMAALVIETERAWQGMGHVSYGATEAEKNSLQFRRSLYVTEDLAAGTTLTAGHVRAIRPGFGLPPKHFDKVIGRQLKQAVRRGTPVSWDILA
jgi:pseudaminic acid synthase